MKSLHGCPLVQIGIIVRDVEAKAAKFADLLGLDPPPLIEVGSWEETRAELRGAPMREGRCRQALFPFGQVTIELIQPLGGPSTWAEHLEKHGEGVHHIAFEVRGMERGVEALGRIGAPLLQRGEFPGGRYAYFDSADQLGVILELLEIDREE